MRSVCSTTPYSNKKNSLAVGNIRVKNESGTTNWTFHDFRRSIATALADDGVDQFAIKCALNHKDSSVTGVYNRSHHVKMKSAALAKWRGLIKQNETPSLLPIRAVK